MHKIFNFLSATDIWFGIGETKRVGEACKDLKLKSVLVVSDPFIVSSGMIKKVTDVLDKESVAYALYTDFGPSPAVSEIENGHSVMKKNQYQGVIGFGGGSSLDTAKSISMLSNNPPPIAQYYGVDKVPKAGYPMILIPTTAGTGSEVSNASIVKDDKTHIKNGVCSKYLMSDISIIDPELTVSMPSGLTASTGMDALTHGVEGYVSNYSNTIARLLQREAIRLIFANLRDAVGNGNNLEAREKVMLGSMYSGWAMSVTRLGACHAMAYPVEGKYGVSHGDANAALLPAVMRYNALGSMERFREMAVYMGENVANLTVREAAYKAVEAVEILTEDIGIKRLSQVGVEESDFAPFAENSVKNTRLMSANPRFITTEAAMDIYRNAF
jgi:alcohol dehydrogenase